MAVRKARKSVLHQEHKRDAITLRTFGRSYQEIADELGVSKTQAFNLVQEGLADIPMEALQDHYDAMMERLHLSLAEAAAIVHSLVPLRVAKGNAVYDEDDKPIMVALNPMQLLTAVMAFEKITLDIAKFTNCMPVGQKQVEHTGTVNVGAGRYVIDVESEEEYEARVAASARPRQKMLEVVS